MAKPNLDNETTQTPWLLPTALIAQIASRSDESVRWAIRNGKLVAYKQPGMRGQYLATRAAVAEWLGVPLEDVRITCSERTPGDEVVEIGRVTADIGRVTADIELEESA